MIGRDGELFHLEFSSDVLEFFETHGAVPLPPYIERAPEAADRERYQTVYARDPGAVAAPTAGLHFDADIFAALADKGVGRAFVTLHVGAGTFQPVRVDDIDRHEMHVEYLDRERGRLRCDRRSARRRRPSRSRSARRSCAAWRRAAAAGGAPWLRPYEGRHAHVHQARLQVSRGRCDRHQFPSARIDAADALRRIRGTRRAA